MPGLCSSCSLMICSLKLTLHATPPSTVCRFGSFFNQFACIGTPQRPELENYSCRKQIVDEGLAVARPREDGGRFFRIGYSLFEGLLKQCISRMCGAF